MKSACEMLCLSACLLHQLFPNLLTDKLTLQGRKVNQMYKRGVALDLILLVLELVTLIEER